MPPKYGIAPQAKKRQFYLPAEWKNVLKKLHCISSTLKRQIKFFIFFCAQFIISKNAPQIWHCFRGKETAILSSCRMEKCIEKIALYKQHFKATDKIFYLFFCSIFYFEKCPPNMALLHRQRNGNFIFLQNGKMS